MFNGKIHYKWPFSIAMSNYQRVHSLIIFPLPNLPIEIGVPMGSPIFQTPKMVRVDEIQRRVTFLATAATDETRPQ